MHGKEWMLWFSTPGIGGSIGEILSRKNQHIPFSVTLRHSIFTPSSLKSINSCRWAQAGESSFGQKRKKDVLFHMISIFCAFCRWDYVQDGSTVSKDMDRLVAFSKGLSTWAQWVNQNVDSSKTKVFFQGISPSHYE